VTLQRQAQSILVEQCFSKDVRSAKANQQVLISLHESASMTVLRALAFVVNNDEKEAENVITMKGIIQSQADCDELHEA